MLILKNPNGKEAGQLAVHVYKVQPRNWTWGNREQIQWVAGWRARGLEPETTRSQDQCHKPHSLLVIQRWYREWKLDTSHSGNEIVNTALSPQIYVQKIPFNGSPKMVAVSLLVTVCTIFEMKGRKNNLKIWNLWNLKQATKRLMKDSILSKCHLKSWTYFQNPSHVTVYTRTSEGIVSMLCSIHYLWCWKG